MIPVRITYSGENSTHLLIGNLELWFSYKTVVAFKYKNIMRVSENLWGSTTGKHLNWIDGGTKENRMMRDMFENELQHVLFECGFREQL